jgi:hypothetical protein
MWKSPYSPPLDPEEMRWATIVAGDLPRVEKCWCLDLMQGQGRREACKPDPLCLRLHRVFTVPIRLDRTGAA